MSGEIMGIIAGLLLATLFNTIVLFIVGKVLKLGIEIDNNSTVFIAALLCSIFGVLVSHFLTASIGDLGSTGLHILGSTLILMIVSKMLKGMHTKGILGALVAAIAMGVVSWLLASLVKSLV